MKRPGLLILGVMTLSIASSCSLLNINTPTTGQTAQEKNIVQEALIPTDREAIVSTTESSTYSPEELAKGVVNGDWAIQKVFGHEAVGECTPFLKFDSSEKMVYGNNGCNTLNANFIYNPADSTMTFSNMLTTMRACAESGLSDYEINSAINQTRYYRWDSNDSEFFLYLLDEGHRELMVLMHQNFQFLNGTWLVETLNGTDINVGNVKLSPDMKLVIDVDESKLHGNTGCNILNGSLETDMETPNSISFQNIAVTKMSCPDTETYEKDLIVALEEITTAHPNTKDRVEMMDGSGQVIMTLIRE